MIKLTKHIKINIITVFLFAFGKVFHYPVIFYITYGVMVLHELAHMLAAVFIGLKIDYIALQPFGANLRLKNKMIYSMADEVILYLSGPLVNASAAVVSAVIYKYCGYDVMRLFYISNIALFAANMLPAAPLDGGVVFRRILAYCFGYRTAFKISKIVSFIICAIIGCAGVIALAKSRNFSFIMFSLLILGNIFTQNEKYYETAGEAQIINRLTDNNITV